MTHCAQSCVNRQNTKVVIQKDRKRKAAATAPQPVPRKSKQLPREPETGSRRTVYMFASFRNKMQVPAGVPLNAGRDTRMMSMHWADSHGVPLVTRIKPKIVENCNGETVEEARLQYTYPPLGDINSIVPKKPSKLGQWRIRLTSCNLTGGSSTIEHTVELPKKTISSTLHRNTAIHNAQRQWYHRSQLNITIPF